MRPAASMARETFAQLRRQIAKIEANVAVRKGAAPVSAPPVPGMAIPDTAYAPPDRSTPTLAPRRANATLPFGIPKLDDVLGGGLRRAALHELRTDESRNAAAVTGFAVALLARLALEDSRPFLWIVDQNVGRETGLPYGVGLRAFGIDPSRLIIVRVKQPVDALWVFEEGLRCAGIYAVVTELGGNPRSLDLTASRRLALRAAETGITGLLLRPSAHSEPGAASSRWHVSPLPSAFEAEYPDGIGRPAWRLALERNRHGITGTFDVEWNHEQRRFAPAGTAPAHPRSLAAVSVDRSPPPPEQRKVMAFAEAGAVLPREEKRRRLRSRG
jgi:protein ImuA